MGALDWLEGEEHLYSTRVSLSLSLNTCTAHRVRTLTVGCAAFTAGRGLRSIHRWPWAAQLTRLTSDAPHQSKDCPATEAALPLRL